MENSDPEDWALPLLPSHTPFTLVFFFMTPLESK